jgi:hypothetical protein
MMWCVEDFEAAPVVLDFTSAGQGRRPATAITTAGVRLCNAIELIDVDPAATQVTVCEHCGFTQCSPGGWVAFRRLGDRVIWIPVWDKMEAGGWERTEYDPPSFFASNGSPVFSQAAWHRLRQLHSGLPRCEELPAISSREIARLCQWSAPAGVLGEYPAEPRLDHRLLVAVTDGDLMHEANAVDMCLHAHFGSVEPMAIARNHSGVRPIEFWLDLPGTPGWTSFGHAEGSVCFLIDGEFAIIEKKG